jgi:hypothetical protein
MALPNIFHKDIAEGIIARINHLTPETQRKWGTMDVSQMLAHCCVTYEYIYEPDKFPKPGFMLGLVLKTVVKKAVTNEKSYKHNLRTGPDFIVKEEKNFEYEKKRLIDFINRVQQEGETKFDGKISHSFGKLDKKAWNNMFYKHLDHHLTQFGV